jgi:hypothetical protein
MGKSFARWCRNAGPFVWAVFYFGLLWTLDFPKPFIDDLFNIGAALNLAGGGAFANPLLVRQQFPTSRYFFHPPLQSYLLSVWLKLFGVSAASLTGFQCLVYLVICWATIAILRRHRAPSLLEWLVPLGVSAAFLPIGLRHEPLSAALVMAGFAAVECGFVGTLPPAPILSGLFIGFLLMFLGWSVAERFIVFNAVLIFLAAYRLWRATCCAPVSRPRTTRRWVPAAGTALLAAALTFLLQIDFRLSEFLRTIHLHAVTVLGGDKPMLLVQFLLGVGITQKPVLVMLLVVAVWALRYPLDDLARIGLCLTCALPCVAFIGGLGCGAIWFPVLAVLLLTGSVVRHTTAHLAKAALLSLICVVLVAFSSKDLVNILGIISGRIQSGASNRSEVVALRPSPEHPLLIDASTARYVFDYRLPAGSIDWSFAAPFPGALDTHFTIRPGDVYLLGPSSVHILTRKGCLDLPTPQWAPLGLRRWAYEQQPRRAWLIRAEDCKPPRPTVASPTRRAIWRSLLTGEDIHQDQ